jgi:cysteine desulfurase
MNRPVYLDHNATTPVRPEVVDAMLPFLREDFGNPNSVYMLGQRARKAVERARGEVARLLGAAEAEIVFTSCGSESDVLAISGAAWQARDESAGKRNRIVSTPIEHDAVREKLKILKRRGFAVDLIPVDKHAKIDLAAAGKLIGEDVAVVTVMHANNEVGTIQPIAELSKLCKAKGALFHTDAVQSAGKLAIDVAALGVDLLSISGHKINAPKGVGALYVRKGTRLVSGITGHQEKNRRGGTENVSGIVGLGVAARLAKDDLARAGHYLELRERLEKGVLKIKGVKVNGHPAERLPNGSHFSIDGVDGHHLVVALDLESICVSAGPACSSGSSTPSHVLTAMGVEDRVATGSLRVSLGWGSTEADIDRLLAVLPGAVEKLRAVPASL